MNDPSEPPPGNYQIPLVDDGSRSAVPPSIGGASNSAAPPSNKDDFSARNVTLYSLVGLFFVTAAGTGALLYDSHPWLGGFAALSGIVGFIVTMFLLLRYHPKTAHALIASIAALVATWIFLGYVVWTRPKAEDIDKEIAPIKTALKSEKQRADNTQLQLGQLQIQLETAEERLTKASAQLGPRSPILKLDDARRWQIVKSMIEAMPEATQQGCSVDVAYDMSNQPEFRKSANIWGEVQEPLFFAGWRFHQIPKTFFPPGISITVGAKTGYAHECAARLKDLLDQLNIRPSAVVVDQGATNLITCNNQCIQVAIGKLDAP